MNAKDWLKNYAEKEKWATDELRKSADYVCRMVSSAIHTDAFIGPNQNMIVERAICQEVTTEASTGAIDHVRILCIATAINGFRQD